MSNAEIARIFILRGIQEWGQGQRAKDDATKAYLKAAGFDLRRDLARAQAWLSDVLTGLRRGELGDEIKQLEAALNKRVTPTETAS